MPVPAEHNLEMVAPIVNSPRVPKDKRPVRMTRPPSLHILAHVRITGCAGWVYLAHPLSAARPDALFRDEPWNPKELGHAAKSRRSKLIACESSPA